jgi:hypothetical protein
VDFQPGASERMREAFMALNHDAGRHGRRFLY